VAAVFSAAARARGAEVAAYDHHLERAGGRAVLEGRVRAAGIRFAPLAEALGGAEIVLSTVRNQSALEVACRAAGHLRPGQLFVDLNSTSAAAKLEIGRAIERSGADFAEAVILEPVRAAGTGARVLTGGAGGAAAAGRLRDLGLNADFYSSQPGKTATFKMLRSIFSKGVEALLLELLVAGRRAGMEKDLWDDVVAGFMSRHAFVKVASTWIETHPAACARRHHELTEVLETMREIGAAADVTSGAEALFRRSCGLGLKEALDGKAPTVESVVEALDRRLEGRR
jgi:3-hydroxyisobutyrate dehydrogenase-like beta-hydroxyacid dehydrogenase